MIVMPVRRLTRLVALAAFFWMWQCGCRSSRPQPAGLSIVEAPGAAPVFVPPFSFTARASTAAGEPDLLVYTIIARNTSDTTAYLAVGSQWPELRSSADISSSPVFPERGAPANLLTLTIHIVAPHDSVTSEEVIRGRWLDGFVPPGEYFVTLELPHPGQLYSAGDVHRLSGGRVAWRP